MWDFDSMFGKTKTYFARAAELEHSDDDEFVIWHLSSFFAHHSQRFTRVC